MLGIFIVLDCSQSISYSNSKPQSCTVVDRVVFGGRIWRFLYGFYLVRGFSRDCIVILLSVILIILIYNHLLRSNIIIYQGEYSSTSINVISDNSENNLLELNALTILLSPASSGFVIILSTYFFILF